MTNSIQGATSSASLYGNSQQKGPQSQKDEFLTMLTAQMTNQDPTEPMKTHEMTAQLAQISTVEQLEKNNLLTSQLMSGISSLNNFASLETVGKDATLALGSFKYDGTSEINLSGDLKLSEKHTDEPIFIQIKDSKGRVVNEIEVDPSKSNEWTWDGKDSNGNKLPEGDYNISAHQKQADGESGIKEPVPLLTKQTIAAISFQNGGQMSLSGGITVPMGGIVEISEPS